MKKHDIPDGGPSAPSTWYREVAPPPILADCVVSLWETRIPDLPGPARVRILPNACVDVVLYKSETSRGEGAASVVAPPHRSYLVGSTLREFLVRSVGWRHVIGASLRPEGVEPLLDLPAALIGDRVAVLEDVIGPTARELEDRVLSAPAEDAMRTLGDVLIERRARAQAPPDLLRQVAAAVRRSHGRRRISAIAADLSVSPRRLERHFLTHVGMSPKLFSRLVRFDRAVRGLPARGTTSWADFAIAYGYADQAHFINEFREFAGVPPAEFEHESQ